MKRPVLCWAVCMICGCLLAAAAQVFWGYILAASAVIGCLAFKAFKRRLLLLVLCAFFLIAGYALMKNGMEVRRTMEEIEEGTLITVTGKINDIEENEYGIRLYIKTEGGLCAANFYNSGSEELCIEDFYRMLGYSVRVTGTKKNFNEASNAGSFDERSYSYSRGIILKLSADELEITDESTDEFKAAAYRIRQSLSDTLSCICNERLAGVFMAILYGEDGQMNEEIKELFSDCGISHILVISGLHISLAGMGIFYLLKRLFSQAAAVAASSLLMTMYVFIAGGSVSSLRAVIMFVILLVGRLTGRMYDMKNAIAIAAVILIAINPYSLFNTGFLLSFGSVFCIAFILPYVSEFMAVKNKLLNSLIAGVTINISNGPIIANTYFQLSPYSVILNLIVIPLMSLVVIFGFLGLIVGLIFEKAGAVIIFPAELVIYLYELLCRLVMKLPFAVLVTGHFTWRQLILYYGILCAAAYGMYKINENKKNRFLKAAAGTVGIGLSMFLYISVPKRNVITFLDVGQGESCVFVSGSGMVCIFDAGSSSVDNCADYNIIPYLKYRGIDHIDYLILSHSDEDHINGADEILKDNALKIDNVIIPAKDTGFSDLTDIINGIEGTNLIYATEGVYIEDDGTKITLLNPPMDLEASNEDTDVNERSIAALIETNGGKIVLTGDIGEETEEALAEKYDIMENTDILKVSHHGSKYSSSEKFLSLLSPRLAVISCGENNIYGHPHEQTLERLSMYSEITEITYESGAITVYLDNFETLNYSKIYDK